MNRALYPKTSTIDLRRLPIEPSNKATFVWLRHARQALRALIPLLVILLWQVTSSVVTSEGFQLPSPTDVMMGFVELWRGGDIQSAIPASLARAGAGLAFGLAIGLTFGVANGLARLAEELFDSTLQIIRVIPFIAVVPLFLVWFGIGETMKLVLISLACTFPVYINTYSAVKLVDQKLVEVGRTFAMSRREIVMQIVIPAAFPTILVGVRYAMSTSLLALIVAEQVNSNAGIGHIIYLASNALRIDLIMAGIIMYAVLGILVDVFMRIVERYSMPWLARSKA
ncbi:ABC transporter permease [Caballeronia sp. dw_19]|uniref:ABC transporter permease n=1 Tax=Caballeronia sp. dw_19 TaxID=2719791 RepID=UPI001BD36680|nr:ABC transporter permease [Caballeronia sp. dw_19]